MSKSKIFKLATYTIILYLISTGVSFAAFRLTKGKEPSVATSPLPQTGTDQNKYKIEPELPRTEVCPLNGVKYPKKYRQIWETRRPLGVMIENSIDARPQSGLSLADIIYEAVAEGGTTRFLAIFHCGSTLGNISLAPVRSARVYFINWVLEYDALYNHVGGANRYGDNVNKTDPRADAIGYIHKQGVKDLDQFGISFPDCYRNYDRLDHLVATEHTMVCLSDNLYKIAEKREWTNVDENGKPWDKNFVSWKFKKDVKENERGNVTPIEFNFWQGYKDYAVRWEYDKKTNTYKRFTAGKVHEDLETGQQLTGKNIVIQFALERRGVDQLAHLLYDTIGSGKALIFQDGKVISATWKKQSPRSRTRFYYANGQEISFNPGQIWIELLSTFSTVAYPK